MKMNELNEYLLPLTEEEVYALECELEALEYKRYMAGKDEDAELVSVRSKLVELIDSEID